MLQMLLHVLFFRQNMLLWILISNVLFCKSEYLLTFVFLKAISNIPIYIIVKPRLFPINARLLDISSKKALSNASRTVLIK